MVEFSFSKSSIEPISSEQYKRLSLAKYTKLLDSNGDTEKAFQIFFKRNPAFLPGANAEFNGGNYGHSVGFPFLKLATSIKFI